MARAGRVGERDGMGGYAGEGYSEGGSAAPQTDPREEERKDTHTHHTTTKHTTPQAHIYNTPTTRLRRDYDSRQEETMTARPPAA